MLSPYSSGNADEFDGLMGEAIERGTSIDAARARHDAAEASVQKAWSKFLPSIKAHSEFGYNRNNAFGQIKGLGRDHYDNSQIGVSANLPLYRGGANYYGLKEARDNASAEGFSLEDVRQMLLLNTARAILGIIRDREIVSLQRENRTIVGTILQTTERRFDGGEATRTDIELSRDQYTAAQSVYTQAIDNLQQNEAEFERLIGRKPGRLRPPRGIYARLPKSLADAIALAEQQNPQLLAAGKRASAARHALSASYSKFLPNVDLNMDYTEDRYHGITSDDESDFSVKLKFSMPLYQPDAVPAQDESRHVSRQRQYEERDARYQVRAMATVAWRSFHAARKQYRLSLSRIKAAEAAARGMRRELDAGQRTVLDVLDTQERLVEARVQAASAKYESYMSAHLLLSAVGELDVYSQQDGDLSEYVNAAAKTYKKTGGKKRKHRPLNTDWKLKEAALKRRYGETTGAVKERGKSSVKATDKKIVLAPWAKKTVATGKAFVKRIEVARIALPKLKPVAIPEKALVKKPVVLSPLRVKKPVLLEKAKPSKKPVVDPETSIELMRKGIYTKRKLRRDDQILTGALPDKEGEARKTTRVKRVGALRYHNIPLPKRKLRRGDARQTEVARREDGAEPDPVVTGAIGERVEEYPDTYNNRMAIWWNKIDSALGTRPKNNIKLIPLDDYYAKRKAVQGAGE